MSVANKEVREALYWLRLTYAAKLVEDAELGTLMHEADELVAILTSSIRTARQHERETSARQ